MDSDVCVLLINPEELMLLGLTLVPEASRYFAIGEPSKSWQSLVTFLVDALEDLASCWPQDDNSQTPRCRAQIGETGGFALQCPDTLAVRNVEAGPHKIRIQLEWCGREREMIYFLCDIRNKWPVEVSDANVVIDIGPNSHQLNSYAQQLSPILAPKAILLATAEDYDSRFYPYFPHIEKPRPPKPNAVATLFGTSIYRFECLRALLEPQRHQTSEECAAILPE
jgi:hypothetical protein